METKRSQVGIQVNDEFTLVCDDYETLRDVIFNLQCCCIEASSQWQKRGRKMNLMTEIADNLESDFRDAYLAVTRLIHDSED